MQMKLACTPQDSLLRGQLQTDCFVPWRLLAHHTHQLMLAEFCYKTESACSAMQQQSHALFMVHSSNRKIEASTWQAVWLPPFLTICKALEDSETICHYRNACKSATMRRRRLGCMSAAGMNHTRYDVVAGVIKLRRPCMDLKPCDDFVRALQHHSNVQILVWICTWWSRGIYRTSAAKWFAPDAVKPAGSQPARQTGRMRTPCSPSVSPGPS